MGYPIFEPGSKFGARTAELKRIRADIRESEHQGLKFELLTIEEGLVSKLWEELHRAHAIGGQLALNGQVKDESFTAALLSYSSFLSDEYYTACRRGLWSELPRDVRDGASLRGLERLQAM